MPPQLSEWFGNKGKYRQQSHVWDFYNKYRSSSSDEFRSSSDTVFYYHQVPKQWSRGKWKHDTNPLIPIYTLHIVGVSFLHNMASVWVEKLLCPKLQTRKVLNAIALYSPTPLLIDYSHEELLWETDSRADACPNTNLFMFGLNRHLCSLTLYFTPLMPVP